MRMIGIDISKGIATCVMLEALPTNLKEFARGEKFTYWHAEVVKADLEAIAALEPDAIVYEPSGGKYERAFTRFFEKKEIECRKVAGRRLAIYRAEKGLPKDDHFDGLAIAAYGLEKWSEAGAFIPPLNPEIEHLRDLWLQRHALNRQRSAMIARLRQNLAYEFPEAAEFSYAGSWGRDEPGLLLWLNGDRDSRGAKMWENRYNAVEVVRQGYKVQTEGTIGSGLSDYTKLVSRQLLEIVRAIGTIESAIEEILAKPDYEAYTKAMNAMNFSESIQAVWLTRIYPFSKFMDKDGGERVTRRMSGNGKWCTHNQSLAQFKAALGAAIDRPVSGTTGIAPTKTKWQGRKKGKGEKVPIGCKFCRVAFWQWASRRIETGKAKGELATKLIEKRNVLKEKDRNIFQRSGNLHGYACKLLYRELKRELTKI